MTGHLSLENIINKDTDKAIFEALFVAVKEVLLKSYLTNSTTFKKSADIYMFITTFTISALIAGSRFTGGQKWKNR